MTTTAEPVLQVRRLYAGYGGRAVIDGLDLPALRTGQVAAFVGPNAAGKSTLLRAIAHLVEMRGDVRLGDRDIGRMAPAARARAIGYMPQALPNDAAISVLESVVAALMVTGAASGDAPVAEQALAVLERLGIGHLASQRLDRLSGGQRQAAGLAQAIAGDPAVLLLDEPTSALDPARQFLIMQVVRAHAARGRIVGVVLHDLALAAQWADQMVVLSDGRLHSAGPPADVLTAAMLRAVYDLEARVERCSRGRLQILVDGVAAPARRASATP